MNCLEFENVVHDITRNNDVVSPWQRGLDHAQGCERCAVLLAEARAVHASLRILAVTDGDKQAGPGVEAALLAAFRKNRVVVPASPRWKKWAVSGAVVGAVAAAAVLALVLSFHGGLNRPQTAFGVSPVTHVSAPAKPAAAPVIVAAVKPEMVPAVAEVSAGVNPTAAVESANASDGAFTPLPDSDDSLPLDGGAVIRVTMQKSMLASFGLQVSDDDANSTEQIAADVVVDQAGMPRAIRVIQ
jgi:hypothetical protein